MILKIKAVLLFMSMLAVNAKVSQVMHSSGRNRGEAKRVEQILAKTQVQEQEQQCAAQSDYCWWDSDCCGDMECLGFWSWQCGYSPRREGEFCNIWYSCDPDLLCYERACTDYADILDYGEYEGTCAQGSPSGELKVMTYNTFLLSCVTGLGPGLDIPCQHTDAQSERVARMMKWAQTRDEDVIVFQELFNLRHQVTQGMVAAGFCHYVVTPFGDNGDGTAIFSKHPIGEFDFTDYYDFFGEDSVGVPFQAEAFATDRGILEAEILKDGISHHVLNTHTLSNSVKEEHTRRLVQYMAIRMAGASKSPNDSVLFAGDLNENKYNEDVGDEYYQAMLQELDAFEPNMIGNQQFSYDNVNNPLLAVYFKPEDEKYQQLLDYVLVSNAHLQPVDSYCDILTPVWPENCGNDASCQISDHYPVTCTYLF